MEIGVYLDILLLLNWIIAYFIMKLTGLLLGRQGSAFRMLLGGFIFSLSSLMIFMPSLPWFSQFGIQLTFSLLGVYCAFPKMGVKGMGLAAGVFFLLNLVFAGLLCVIFLLFRPQGMLLYNGVCYFNLSPLLFVLFAAVFYGVFRGAHFLLKGRQVSGERFETSLYFQGNKLTLSGFLDTGNHLREQFSNAPVMLGHPARMKGLLPEDLLLFCEQNEAPGQFPAQWITQYRVRWIPYHTLGETGLLPAVRLDRAELIGQGSRLEISEVYLGLTQCPLPENCDLILPGDLVMQTVL